MIETGVDTSHADFAGSHISVSNFTGQKLRPAAHGTAVTGIIAATGDNHLGIVGIGWRRPPPPATASTRASPSPGPRPAGAASPFPRCLAPPVQISP